MKFAEVGLSSAFDAAQTTGVGFAHDFAPELLTPLQHLADTNPSNCWQELALDDFTDELFVLQGIVKSYAQRINRPSNMDFVHIIHRIKGSTHWHYDVSDDDTAAAGYIKGRFRAGYNLYGNVEFGYEDSKGVRSWEPITPGTLYVMDYTHNLRHGARPMDDASASMFSSKVLLLTDVAKYSEYR